MPSGVYKRIKPNGMKGKCHTEETRKKISNALKNRVFSESHKKKIGLANRNRKYPPMSEEGKKHISESLKGRIFSDEWKNKISQSRLNRKKILGYLNSPETRKKMSEAHMGHIPWNKGKSGEYKMKLNKPRLGVRRGPLSEETKRKIGLAHKGKIISEEHKKRLRETRLGKKASQETRKKMSISHSHERHWNWQDGKSFEPYTSEFNRQLKELIRHRDGYRCQKCGCSEIENLKKLSTHHIDYDKENCLPNNLITLCVRCNTKVNKNPEKWIRYFQRKIKIITNDSCLQLSLPIHKTNVLSKEIIQ